MSVHPSTRRVLALVLVLGGCSRPVALDEPAATPSSSALEAVDARRIADALIASTDDTAQSTFQAIDENEEEFLVHYSRRTSCPEFDPPEPDLRDDEPDGRRDFTDVVNLCPTASPGGFTIRVRKLDGHARYIGGE